MWDLPLAQPSDLLGRTVVIVGSCTPTGPATARCAKRAGAQLIITDRRTGPLEDLADEIGVEATATFDESDPDQLEAFLGGLPGPIDHLVLCGGEPRCTARYVRQEMRDGGSLVVVTAIGTAGWSALVASLAAAVAPIRVNLIIGGVAEAVASLAVRLMIDPSVSGAVVSPEAPCGGSGVN
ncbi:hypothetical protein ODJ79_40765 [Actinoplanes sp. KI2]|uniref:hypothetical protein n=1 Tax=Actinoplanes sp. KI2 TaxID=2983315 RepID=UPI0021D5C1BE|nr:hypothetical protein [Actinoplanes sp. KI2]MCU7730086.1 hypothetical protein [Actinoplanes sp. KI2]